MSAPPPPPDRPEHNVTGLDFSDRAHFRYHGPLIDIHAHVMVTRPDDPKTGAPSGKGPGASVEQAETMLAVAEEFGIVRTYSMCYPDDIPVLRDRFSPRLGFNGSIAKKTIDAPDEEAYRLLDRYLELGVEIIKFWSAPRGRDRGLFVDAPWRKEAARRARAAGVRIVMVHVADPDSWFQTVYSDSARYGTKRDQYVGLERMLEEFPDLTWIGAHMGGDSEHPDHLADLLERYPHLYLDTSATKWQVREVSARVAEVQALICRYPDRFLFGSDLVTRHELPREHYVSRYWCQRTLWESTWEGRSPIADPDYTPAEGEPPTPPLCGLELPEDVLRQVYYENARRILAPGNLPG
ncbi:MAG: amidohydrolase [Gemmataceae bacterium]|nr:amidohydrolase [Gemmataceae bacterium]